MGSLGEQMWHERSHGGNGIRDKLEEIRPLGMIFTPSLTSVKGRLLTFA